MGVEGLLKTWPKNKRLCNLGDCPAFHLTDADAEYLLKASKMMRDEQMTAEEVAEVLGVPSGTCLVTMLEKVVNSKCTVQDVAFVDYFKKKLG